MSSDNINDVIKLGNSIITIVIKQGKTIITDEIYEDVFLQYKKRVKLLAADIKSHKKLMNEELIPALDKLIISDETTYKTNLLTKIFYFKKYQYSGLKYPIFNNKADMRIRYVRETNEILDFISSIGK